MGALSAISDPTLRDWKTDETMTEGLLEADPAAINTAVKDTLDYLIENERHFVSGSAPTDIADGMIWLDSTNQKFNARVNGRWESIGIGVLDMDATAVAPGTGNTGVLHTFTVPASTLDVDLKGLRITCWGTKAGGTADTTLQVRFNTGVQTSFTLAAAITDWYIGWIIVRTGATTQDWNAHIILNRDDTGDTDLVDSGTDAETLSNAIAVDVNVSSINGSDAIVQEGMLVEILN